MDLIYYRSDIKKIIEDFNFDVRKLKKATNIILTIFSILSLIVIGLTIFLKIYFLLIIIAFLLFLTGMYFIIRYYYYSRFFYKHMYRIQEKLFNGEGKYQIRVLEKKEVIALVHETRFSEKYDYVSVFEGFKVIKDDFEGYYLNININRSAGNSTMIVIGGELYILNMNTGLDYQIRNDSFKPSKMNKVKFPDYNIYASNLVDVNDEGFYFIKKMFGESKHVGIDYLENQVAVFNKFRFKNLTKFILSDKFIIEHYKHLEMKFNNLEKIYQSLYKDL